MEHQIKVKRVYEAASSDDGYRVLVDRLWPRRMRREALMMDAWLRSVTPSSELRRWFHAHRDRYDVFAERFEVELSTHPEARSGLEDLSHRLLAGPVTLLTAARLLPNHARVLRKVILAEAETFEDAPTVDG